MQNIPRNSLWLHFLQPLISESTCLHRISPQIFGSERLWQWPSTANELQLLRDLVSRLLMDSCPQAHGITTSKIGIGLVSAIQIESRKRSVSIWTRVIRSLSRFAFDYSLTQTLQLSRPRFLSPRCGRTR